MELNSNERIDDLQFASLKIIQDKSKYCFTSDAAILANFVKAKKTETVCEIGTGTGVISILLSKKQNPKKIVAFEIQESAANLAKRNVELNNLENQIEIINAPIQDYLKFVRRESFDVVATNPPYTKLSKSGLVSKCEEEAISKHEVCLTLSELISCSTKLLKFGGRFYVVYDAKRTAELIYKLKQNNLEPKKMFFTAASENSNPILVLIEAVKGGKEGICILPTLITNDKDGNYLFSIQKLYNP